MANKRLTPLQVVKVKCTECSETLKDARKCEMDNCALYHHKAGKKDGKQTMSASQAMKAFCIQCCNGDKKEPKLCTAVNCPIYIFNKQKEKEKEARKNA